MSHALTPSQTIGPFYFGTIVKAYRADLAPLGVAGERAIAKVPRLREHEQRREHHRPTPGAAHCQSSFCPKIARFDECPGLTFLSGYTKCTAWFTAMHASAKPVAISLSLPG